MRTNVVMGSVNVQHGPPLLHLVREKLSTGAQTRAGQSACKWLPAPLLSAPSLIQRDINHGSGLFPISSENT